MVSFRDAAGKSRPSAMMPASVGPSPYFPDLKSNDPLISLRFRLWLWIVLLCYSATPPVRRRHRRPFSVPSQWIFHSSRCNPHNEINTKSMGRQPFFRSEWRGQEFGLSFSVEIGGSEAEHDRSHTTAGSGCTNGRSGEAGMMPALPGDGESWGAIPNLEIMYGVPVIPQWRRRRTSRQWRTFLKRQPTPMDRSP